MRASASLAVAALLASGCIGTERPAEAVVPPPVERGGVLRIGTTNTLAVDPLAIDLADPLSVVVADAAFDGLTAFDPATRRVVGSLASEWSTVDGRVWEFQLDETRSFGDGRAVRAIDVIASLERAATDERQPLAAARLELIEGVEELRSGAAPNASGLQSVDGGLRVSLAEANYELPAILADPTYGVVAPDDDGDPVVGSGPYGSIERDGSLLTLRRVAPAGALESVTVRTFDSAEDVRAAFERDELDVRVAGNDEVAGEVGPGAQWVSAVTLYLGVNTLAPGLDDSGVRRALLSAVDPEAIGAAVGSTRARVAGALLPGDLLAAETCADCFVDDGDDEGRRSIEGADVRLLGLGAGVVGVGATSVEAELVDAGAVVSRPDTDGEGVRAAVLTGEWDLVVFAQIGLVPSPDPLLGGGFTSTGRENVAGWSNPVVDAQVAAARSEPDASTRVSRYAAAELEVRKEAVARPLVALGSTVLLQPRVRGAVALGGLAFDVSSVSLDG